MASVSGVSGLGAYLTSLNNTLATSASGSGSQLPTLLSSLGLNTQQQSQISSILQNAQSQGLSPQQVQAQIYAILSPSQQSQLRSELQSRHHHHHGGGGNGGGASSIGQSQTDEFGIPTNLGAATTSSTNPFGSIAAAYSLKSQFAQTPNE
ncbi:MAG TPA: hypothetical protein VMH02_00540 [Verrucomicrobiae bacterium]|nr:hypothetical protein [Verrucomicrobiae bacterium]